MWKRLHTVKCESLETLVIAVLHELLARLPHAVGVLDSIKVLVVEKECNQ